MDENFYQGLLDEGIALQQILRDFNPNLGPALPLLIRAADYIDVLERQLTFNMPVHKRRFQIIGAALDNAHRLCDHISELSELCTRLQDQLDSLDPPIR